MRTTIDLPDFVLRQAKARAALEGLTLKELITSYVVQGLQQGAAQPRQRSAPPVIDESVTGEPIPALSADKLAELGIQKKLDFPPNILEFEGRKAFVVLPYAEYLDIEEQVQELEDLRTLLQAKAQDTDEPAITLAEVRRKYDLEEPSNYALDSADSLPQDLTESLALAADQMETSVEVLIQEAVQHYLAARRGEQLEQEIAAYEAMHARLWQEMPGMWVAIHKGELVDQDHDRVELYRRVQQRFGRKPVLMREVKAEAIEEIWLRTSSTGKLSR